MNTRTIGTSRMRVLMVNWAPPRDGALSGGGANGYAHDLALALSARGHDVAWLFGGLTYIPTEAGEAGAVEVRRLDDHRGVGVYEVVNSPVLAWSLHQFRHPLGEVHAPALEREVLRFFRVWKPDVVHFHNIEGFTSACPGLARVGEGAWAGARVVYSLHNYHTLCPQVYLLKGGREVCEDYENGAACVNCFDAPHTHIVLRDRLAAGARSAGREDLARRILGTPGTREHGVLAALRVRKEKSIDLPGAGVLDEGDVRARAGADAGLGSGSDSGPSSVVRVAVVGGVVRNEVRAAPKGRGAENDYATRRRAMVGMLSGCDRVLAVSEFVRRKFLAMGVEPRVLRTLGIGSRMVELAGRHARERAAKRDGVVRLAFLGYHNYPKGLHVLCAALERLGPEVRRRVELSVHAKDIGPMVAWLRELSDGMSRVVIEDGYRYEDVPRILRGVDVGCVPSVWWDNGPQTVMEFLSCGVAVLGSAVGGIPDLVRDGENGLLVAGNDAGALAKAIERLVVEEGLVERLRAGVVPPKGMAEHAAEVEREYEELRGAKAV